MATPAYTTEQVAVLISTYNDNPTKSTVEKLAGGMGKTVRSVISKLVSEGVYKKVETKKKSDTSMQKAQLVNVIRIMMDARDNEFSSFENASKKDLEAMLRLLKQLNNRHEIKEMK